MLVLNVLTDGAALDIYPVWLAVSTDADANRLRQKWMSLLVVVHLTNTSNMFGTYMYGLSCGICWVQSCERSAKSIFGDASPVWNSAMFCLGKYFSLQIFATSIIEWSITLVKTVYDSGLIHVTYQSEMW